MCAQTSLTIWRQKMTQAQPVTFQQLLDEHAPELAAVVAGARSSITDDGALSSNRAGLPKV